MAHTLTSCAVCKTDFVPSRFHPHSKTCSHKCSARLEYAKHRQSYMDRSKAWAKSNPERYRVLAARTRSRKPELYRAISRAKQQRRVAIMRGVEGSFTAEEWLRLVSIQRGKCWWCGEDKPLHADHVVPVSKGGKNYISNIVGSCQSCNSKKRDSLWELSSGCLFGQSGIPGIWKETGLEEA